MLCTVLNFSENEQWVTFKFVTVYFYLVSQSLTLNRNLLISSDISKSSSAQVWYVMIFISKVI